MKSFQLDECMDAKWLVKACDTQGLAKVLRIPSRLKTRAAREQGSQKDDNILRLFYEREAAILTSDQPILEDNPGVLPDIHCGVIIISNATPTPTTSRKDLQKILARFKEGFPAWCSISWRNSIVQITQEWAETRHLENGTPVLDARLLFATELWPRELAAILNRNADRSAAGTDALPSD